MYKINELPTTDMVLYLLFTFHYPLLYNTRLHNMRYYR